MALFCGIKLGLEDFCRYFRDTLISICEDPELLQLIHVINHGECRHVVERVEPGDRILSMIDYYMNGEFQFRISRLPPLKAKFNALVPAFEERLNLRLELRMVNGYRKTLCR